MKKFYDDITIIIISYKSCDIVKNFIKKIPKKFKVIIVDNSNDLNLKKITKKYVFFLITNMDRNHLLMFSL